jgi:putative heme-binding domain-containing protein
VFAAPSKFAFYIAGHDGVPGGQVSGKNFVRLRESPSDAVLVECAPPMNDTAQKVEWDLSAHQGKQVYLEVVDGNAGAAYAWLAVGRFEPEVIRLPIAAPAQVAARRIAAAEIAGACKAEELLPRIREMAEDRCLEPGVRAAAARVLLEEPVDRAVADLVANPFQPWDWRARLADTFFTEKRDGWEDFLGAVWREAPRRFQVALASITTMRPDFAGELVERMADGRAPAGLLQDRGLRERLRRVLGEERRPILEKLASVLPAEDLDLQILLEQRRAAYVQGPGEASRGREVFANACAACHQIETLGGVVGPQLTGIGTRGLERLCEDILAPNRNVDHAFWTTELTLKDGDIMTGLFRREEGELVVLANAAGAEFSVPKAEILERRESSVSVMPSNFGDLLSAEDFSHLLAFLLGERGVR